MSQPVQARLSVRPARQRRNREGCCHANTTIKFPASSHASKLKQRTIVPPKERLWPQIPAVFFKMSPSKMLTHPFPSIGFHYSLRSRPAFHSTQKECVSWWEQ